MQQQTKKIRLGVSACLLGHKVRFDGGHKHDFFLTNTLGKFVEYVAVCPESECGLGIPREPLRLVGDTDAPRLITVRTKKDYTDRMASWAHKRVLNLEKENLCGFVFKSRSPSSGMQRVKVYNDEGVPSHTGIGIFARIFMEHFPLLPVEDEGRLHDPVLRENFIERVFVFMRWRELLAQKKSLGMLVEFHTRHKLLILSHSPKHAQAMGKLVAGTKKTDAAPAYDQYQRLLMEALRLKTTVKKHTNVLHHMMGYFKKQLSKDEKQELLEVIDNFYREYLPVIVPITLINHYVRKYEQPYLLKQFYLNPHPLELKLRNHV